jgi:hypothetical protein
MNHLSQARNNYYGWVSACYAQLEALCVVCSPGRGAVAELMPEPLSMRRIARWK